jgi:hypothetical protein
MRAPFSMYFAHLCWSLSAASLIIVRGSLFFYDRTKNPGPVTGGHKPHLGLIKGVELQNLYFPPKPPGYEGWVTYPSGLFHVLGLTLTDRQDQAKMALRLIGNFFRKAFITTMFFYLIMWFAGIIFKIRFWQTG